MLIDALDLENGHVLSGDICIVGAGAAGITMARALVDSGLSVLLLEGGGFEATDESMALYEGEMTGRPFGTEEAPIPFTSTRLRHFGGTTNHWAGFCRPLQPIDFEVRSWLPVSGWPISYEELTPWYDQAAEVLELLDTSFDWRDWNRTRETGEPPFEFDALDFKTYQIQPQRFGPRYRDELVTADDVTVCINANATRIDIDADTDRVTGIDLATLEGTEFRAEAEVFVLAMGGIENPRLLLASADQRPAGIGNENDLVGRYFTEHVQAVVGLAALTEGPEANDSLTTKVIQEGEREVAYAMALTLADDVIAEEQLVVAETQFFLGSFPEGSPWQVEGVEASSVAAMFGAVSDNELGSVFTVGITSEQQLDPDSRLTLTDEVDALGVPRVNLHWKQGDIERRSMVRLAEVLSRELGRTGKGRVQLVAGKLAPTDQPMIDGELLTIYEVNPGPSPSPEAENAALDYVGEFHVGPGNHHMCTTRMAAEPAEGVVDGDCKVFSTENLYVAGSSVFATGGLSPPTFTIVALALRLADHLRSVLV